MRNLEYLTKTDKEEKSVITGRYFFISQAKTYLQIFILLIAGIFLSGCDLLSEDSDDVTSENIYILAELTAKGNSSTYIKVNLHKNESFGQPLELVNGDKLTVSYLGNSVELTKDNNIVEIDYTASIANQGQGGTYTLTFDRHDGSQITSTVIMPEPYTINSPSEHTVFKENDNVTVTWSPAVTGNDLSFHGHLRCKTYEDDLSTEWDNENETWLTSDDGEYLLPLNKLISNLTLEITLEDEHFDNSVPCSLDFDISRTNHGDLAGKYESGSRLIAVQYRQIENLSVWLLAD